MRAVLCNSFDGIEGLTIGEAKEPPLGADEVLIDVHAASVSYMDYLMACGRYQMQPPLPYVPGTDSAGVIVACGEDVKHFSPGDRVTCGGWFGGFAERRVAKASNTARLPENMDFIAGSTLQHIYVTAWYALVERARLQAGETLLVTGASGGVGLACVELAHLLGARVIAAVGAPSKMSVVRKYGAEAVIDYSKEDIRERVAALTNGGGLDVCVDNIGGMLFLTLARLMRWNGRLLPMGFTGGEIPALPMNLPLLKNYSIVGVFAGAWPDRFANEATRARNSIMALAGEGKLRPHIHRVLPLDRAADAMRAIVNRTVQGRIVLQVK
jgi:NADPH2:quinone reductase